MSGGTHPDQGGSHARRRAYKLDGALRVGGETTENFIHERWQAPAESSLQKRSAGAHCDARGISGSQCAAQGVVWRGLIACGERFSHRQIVRQLNHAEMMIP